MILDYDQLRMVLAEARLPWVRNFINESKVDAFGLFTGQVGYAAKNVLFYLKGGAAVVSDNSRVLDPTRNVLSTMGFGLG